MESIDLGLSVKWATMNVGANNDTEYGLYYQWGDIKGYEAHHLGIEKSFNANDYLYYGVDECITTLDSDHDMVKNHMGESWRLPTINEFNELIDATNCEWVENYKGEKINGILMTIKNDEEKRIFFPAVGMMMENLQYGSGSSGFYWTRDSYEFSDCCSWCLSFFKDNVSDESIFRYFGAVARAVKEN